VDGAAYGQCNLVLADIGTVPVRAVAHRAHECGDVQRSYCQADAGYEWKEVSGDIKSTCLGSVPAAPQDVGDPVALVSHVVLPRELLWLLLIDGLLGVCHRLRAA
jgi:hypothetical protein